MLARFGLVFSKFAMVLTITVASGCGSGDSSDDSETSKAGPYCGNSIREAGEACDGEPYCAECLGIEGECGDGIVQDSDEECDSGSTGGEGCVQCEQVFSWLCAGEPSACERTGLPQNLTIATSDEDSLFKYCEWFGDVLFGEQDSIKCSQYVIRRLAIEDCVGNMPELLGSCTIADMEEWVGASSSSCSLIFSDDHPCVDAPIFGDMTEEDPVESLPDYDEMTAAECYWWDEETTSSCDLCIATHACDSLGSCYFQLNEDEMCGECWSSGDPTACRDENAYLSLRRSGLAYCFDECAVERDLCNVEDNEDSCTTCLEESCCEEFAECANHFSCSECWQTGDCLSVLASEYDALKSCSDEKCGGCL